MKVTIKRRATGEENVSRRNVSYDILVDGVYTTTFKDIIDAMDYREWLQEDKGVTK